MARHNRPLPTRVSNRALFIVVACLAFVTGAPAQRTSSPASSASQTPTFVAAPSFSLTGTPTSVATGDLNGDGKQDLVIANSTTGKVSVILGKGNGHFAAAVHYASGKKPSFVAVGDFNGDGKLDVAVANQGEGTVSVFLGNGDGTLQSPVMYSVGSRPSFIAVGDFRGDGKPGLAVADAAEHSIHLLLNEGAGKFGKATAYQLGRTANSLAVADLDGDGHADLVSANNDGTATVLLGRGDGTFRSVANIAVGSLPLTSVVAADFNGDGKADLAFGHSGTSSISVLLGSGDGTFKQGPALQAGNSPLFLAVADVNGDSLPDLISINQASNTFSIFLSNGDGTFKVSRDFVAGNNPKALTVGDFGGTGKADLAIINTKEPSYSIALGNGDGTFKAALAYATDLERKSIASGDLDGDGKPDLVVTNYCGTSAQCTGNGTVSVLLAGKDRTYKFVASYDLGQGPVSIALADVNGDKKLDLIAVNRGDKTVMVLLGNGDGSFQSGIGYPVTGSPVAAVVGDFNKDGNPDLAVVTDCGTKTCNQAGGVQLLLGQPDGSFKAGPSYPVGYSPSAIAVGDVNGDGNADLVVANACGADPACQAKGTASVFFGDGKGSLKSQPDLPLGAAPSSVVLGDLRGNGVLDLVAAHRQDNQVAVFQGIGDGTFKAGVAYAVGTAPSALVIADFNGDGKKDVAVAEFGSSTISALFGNGDSTLQQPARYTVGVGPEALVAVGSAKAGHADLVSANGNTGSKPMGSDISVLNNIQQDVGTVVPTVTVMNTSGNPTSTYGDTVTFTAMVKGDGSGNTPSGTVVFEDNGVAIVDPNCNSTNNLTVTSDPNVAQAVCTTTLLAAATSGTPIVASYQGDTYYMNADSTSITQIINPAKLTITANSSNKNYGQTVTFTGTEFTSSGLQNGETIGSVTLTSAGADPTASVGSYDIIPSAATGGTFNPSNYTITYANGTLTVVAVPLTITANSTSKNYGQTVTFTGTEFTSTGLQNGETIGSVTLSSTGAPATAAVGSYDIIPSAATGGTFNPSNYVITYVNGTLTVDPAPLTITANSSSKVFGQTLTFTGMEFTSTGLQNGETIGSATITSAGAPASAAVGTYDINICCATGGTFNPNNYAITYVKGTLTVGSATLTITANDATKVFGQTLTFTGTEFTSTGLQNGDTIGSVTLTSTGAPASAPAGTYSIVACCATGGTFNPANYTIVYVNGTLTVGKATPVFSGITPSQSITYGTGSIMLTGKISAGDAAPSSENVTININGSMQSAAVLTDGTFHDTFPTSTIPAGSYTITYSYAGDSNFNPAMSDTSTTLTVNKATVTVSVASSLPIAVSTQMVTFTATIIGTGVTGDLSPGGHVEFTDTINGSTADVPGCGSVQLPTPSPGNTIVTAACMSNTLADGGHTITAIYVDDSNYLGGTQNSTVQTIQDYTIAFSSVPAAPIQVLQGYAIGQPAFSSYQGQNVGLTVAPISGFAQTVTVTSCAITPAVANGPTCSPTSGTPISAANYANTAVTLRAGTTSAPSPGGAYTITITTQYQADPNTVLTRTTTVLNFYVVTVSGTIAVVPGGSGMQSVVFSGPASVSNLAYSCPQIVDATTGLVVTQDIHISCSFGTPSQAELPQTVNVTINTNTTTSARLGGATQLFASLWLGAPAMILIGSLRRKKLTRKSILQALGLLLICTALLQSIACGSGGFTVPSTPLTPTGFYQVQVVGMSGGQVQTSAVVPLTVGH